MSKWHVEKIYEKHKLTPKTHLKLQIKSNVN